MQLSQSLNIKQKQSLVMTPQLQQAIKLLQLTNLELKQFLEEQTFDNPFISVEEEALAADKVGFEMLATGLAGKFKNDDDHPHFDQLVRMREAAPTAFMHCGAPDTSQW